MIKILVVDDNKNFLISLCIGLRRNGLLVDSATNAFDAFEMLNENDYDILLSDVKMKGMSGIELTKIAGRKFPDLKIILMTAYDFLEFEQSIEKLILAKLFKPFDLSTLIELINQEKKYMEKFAGASN